MKAIVNARIIKDNSIFDGYTVLFEEKILRLMEGNALKGLEPEEVFDAAGRYLSPGFIGAYTWLYWK